MRPTCRFAPLRFAPAVCLLAGLFSPSPAQDAGWGAVKGQVFFDDDKLPIPVDLTDTVKKNGDAKHCLEKGPIFSEEWVINPKNKGVANVFVWLGPADPKKRTPLPVHPRLVKIEKLEVEMDQLCCKFVPHALAIREGQIIIAKNSSPVSHNFHYGGRPDVNPGENPLIPARGKHVIKDLRADRVPISVKCSFHTWMKGWIRVFDHPYFALTDTNGAFEIKDAPAGDWRVYVWHEGAGFGAVGPTGQPISIKPGQTMEHRIRLNQ